MLPERLGVGSLVGYALLAVVLVLVAGVQVGAAGAALPVALLAFLVGLVLVVRAEPQGPTRHAVHVVLGYVLLWVLALAASTPVSIKDGWYVNGEPPAWADPLARGLAQNLPIALVLGVAAAVWPRSALSGRVLAGGAVALLLAHLVLGVLSVPESFAPQDVERASGFASAATFAFSAACLLLAVAVGIVLARRGAPPREAGMREAAPAAPSVGAPRPPGGR